LQGNGLSIPYIKQDEGILAAAAAWNGTKGWSGGHAG